MPRPRALFATAILAMLLTGCGADSGEYSLGPDNSCDPDQFRVTLQAREDSNPDLVAVDYVLVNQSTVACVLTGTPTVTLLSAIDSTPLGVAQPLNDETPEVITVEPNGVAYLFLWTLKAMTDTATCTGEFANQTRIDLEGRAANEAIVSGSPVDKYCDEPSRETFLVSSFTSEPLEVPGVSAYTPLLF